MKCEEKKQSKDNLKAALEKIACFLEEGEPIKKKDLIEICRESGMELISGEREAHLFHELLEAAINQTIARSFNRTSLTVAHCGI